MTNPHEPAVFRRLAPVSFAIVLALATACGDDVQEESTTTATEETSTTSEGGEDPGDGDASGEVTSEE
jgi:hypothetical protein